MLAKFARVPYFLVGVGARAGHCDNGLLLYYTVHCLRYPTFNSLSNCEQKQLFQFLTTHCWCDDRRSVTLPFPIESVSPTRDLCIKLGIGQVMEMR